MRQKTAILVLGGSNEGGMSRASMMKRYEDLQISETNRKKSTVISTGYEPSLPAAYLSPQTHVPTASRSPTPEKAPTPPEPVYPLYPKLAKEDAKMVTSPAGGGFGLLYR